MPGTKEISVIVCPFHVGILNHRVGNGPRRLLPQLQKNLNDLGYRVTVTILEPVDDQEGEIGRSFELLRKISLAVTQAVAHGSFPLILAGNCHSTVSVCAGLRAAGVDLDNLDIFWMDAHPDAQTPDDNRSGYLDSMGTAMLAGLTWKALMATIQGHSPVPLSQLTFIGIRDLQPGENERIRDGGSTVVYGKANQHVDFARELGKIIDRLPAKRRAVCHLDLDVIDTSVGHANEYAVPGGLLAHDLGECLQLLAARDPVSLTVASFNPDLERGDHVAELAIAEVTRFFAALQDSQNDTAAAEESSPASVAATRPARQ